MSEKTRVEVQMQPQLRRELQEKADAQGVSVNMYLQPFLYAIARGQIRLEAVTDNQKLIRKAK